MGQLLGKARLRAAAEPFVNLDQASVYVLWEAFNDVAEGFGINVEELLEIVSALQNGAFAHAPKQVILVAVEEVFRALDTDQNNLVDSLEVLVTLCMLSGMELRDKAKFCFMCYDFDESGEITVDELTLLLKSCATGLCKLSRETQVPEEAKIEQVAREAFRRTGSTGDVRISCEAFVEHCCSMPEVVAWCDFYDDAEDYNALATFVEAEGESGEGQRAKARNVYAATTPLAAVLCEEGRVVARPAREGKARDPDCNKFPRPPAAERAAGSAPAARLWLETAAVTVPTAAAPVDKSQPDENTLRLDWVHGYSAQHSRGTVRYTASGEIVYNAAAVGVVYSPELHEQRFNLDHSDDILALALHPDLNLVATGERGNPPKIHVWDSASTKLVVTLRGLHSVGVSSLAFSPDAGGRWLVSVGQDPEHTVAVYNWAKRQMVFAARSTRKMVLAALVRPLAKTGASSGAPPSFVTCGEDHIFFWNQDDNRKKKKGVFGKIGAPQTMLALACNSRSGQVISGALSGHLYVWDTNRSLQRTIKAHESAVTALFFQDGVGLLSGGDDGKVRIWSPTLEQGAVFDVAGLGSLRASVASVCYSEDAAKILVGTRACEIFEMSAEDGSNLHAAPLATGHFRGQLHGLAVHPHKPEFCTVGDDQTVRIWDMTTRRMVRTVKLDTRARTCAYSPDGSLIAVGLGAGVAEEGGRAVASKKDGAFLVLNEADLCIVHEARDSKKWIADIKFSVDGATLGIASTDAAIYLYNVEDFASKGKCKGHRGELRDIDFSEDNQCIQSTCSNGELLFWNANTAEQYKKPSTMRDVEWSTHHCPVGYAVQGMWKIPGALDIVTADRTHAGTVMVGADTAGRLRLFRAPVVDDRQGFYEFRAHSGAVRRVRFAFDDSYVLSVGQLDRCVMQWRHEADQAEELQQEDGAVYRNEPDSEDEDDFVDGEVLDRPDAREAVNEQLELALGNQSADVAGPAAGGLGASGLDIEYLDDTDEEGEAAALLASRGTGEDGEDESKSGAAPGVGAAGAAKAPERPWQRLIVPPSNPPKEDHSACEEGLTLEWVHGYNAQASRGSALYLANGEIVYPAANLGVVYSKQGDGLQRFFTDHSDQVIAVSLHPEGKLVATSQLGRVPKIIIWDIDTMAAVQTLSGFHRRGVPVVRFSRDGERLVTAGLDPQHRIAVYDWRNGIVSLHLNGGEQKVLDVDFSPNGATLVQCGINHIKFHDIAGKNVMTRKGLLGKKGKLQAMYCIGWAGNRAVIGTADGHLYGFEGRLLQQSVKGHDKNVNALHACSEGLVSGGKDGWVKLWSTGLECRAQFEIGGGLSSIRSVCWDPEQNRILVGTRACELLEISAADGTTLNEGRPLVSGHSKYELWGLAMHPVRAEYCTVGDDQTVRVWDLASRRMLKSQKLDTSARAVAYAPDGSKIAVGLGARVGRGRQKKDGSFLILNEKDLAVLHEGRNSKQWVTDIKFSPDGATLALGSYDNSLYLYDVGGGYSLKGVFEGHNSFITHLDVSLDGQFVQTNCGAYELMYCDANSGSNIPAVSTLKDVQWNTWTCPLGWPVKGIHGSAGAAEAAIHAVHRNNGASLLLSADEYGRVDLRRFPCTHTSAGKKTYRGHTGSVRNVRFAANDSFAVTVGGDDRCIMQWRVDFFEEDVAVRAGDSGNDSEVVFEAKAAAGANQAGKPEFVALRPWISAVVPPTGAPSATTQGLEAPKHLDVELEHVYGHRAEDVRGNVRHNCNDNIVYFAAATGIVYDKSQHRQTFYLGHDGRPIISLAMHPEGKFVATGEGTNASRSRPGNLVRVHVWNAMSGAGVIKLPAIHKNAASQLAFSADGLRLVSVGDDENHTLVVWRSDSGTWADAKLQATAMGGQRKCLFALFYGDSNLATGGVDHVNFWTLVGRRLTPTRGIFGRKGKVQPMLCAAALGSSGEVPQGAAAATARVITGTVTGHLYVWSGGEVVKSVKAHERSVNAMHACHLGLVTGSKDGLVKLWDSKLSPIRTFDMTEAVPTPHRPAVRTVSWNAARGIVLVGTQGSEIYELTTENQSVVLVSQGHCADELHGLAAHPSDPNLFVTAGDDQTVRLWDASKRALVRETNVGCMTRAITFSPGGDALGVGLGGSTGRGRQKKDGVLMVLNADSLELLHETRDSKEWISDAKFSPDGETLAIASYDSKIYLYDVNKNFELRAKCEGHNSFVTHIDFSDDSEYLRSNCGGFDLLFHKTEDGAVVNSPSMLKDVKWATTTCCLAWPVQGMWPEVTDETNYNACDACEALEVVASGDAKGNLGLFHFPAITKGAEAVRLRAHVSQVANVRFSADGSRIFTTGGPDRAICQWRVTRRPQRPKPDEEEAAAE